MPRKSPIPSCRADELDGLSLVDKTLQIGQDYATQEADSTLWMKCLQCLSQKGRSKNLLELAKPGSSRLVAVSYPNEPGDPSENAKPNRVKIIRRSGAHVKYFQTRKIVLDRILKYAEHVRVKHFWIDQECIIQGDDAKLKDAILAMHLVYRRSLFPVALLELMLSQDEAVRLDLLMSDPKHNFGRVLEQSMVVMLERIRRDLWWSRAWTFQEEYMAGLKLRILMRLEPGVKKDGLKELGAIKDEACVSATAFRKNATIFLLCMRNSEEVCDELKLRCEPLLKTFAKYNVLYQEMNFAESRAMSTSIFAGTEARNLGEGRGYDLLPITANVCEYDKRLRSDALAKSPHSIGMCALTMWLMNGEIFNNNENIARPAKDVGLSEYLKSISFARFRPPSLVFELTWLKKCRLWPVKFSRKGVITSGLLWHIHTKIETFNWDGGQHENCYPGEFRLNAYKRKRLAQLLKKLRLLANCAGLSLQLGRYLNEDDSLPESVEEYMDLMAEEVVEAIRCGNSLYLATLEGPCEANAIFVEGTGDEATDSSTVVDSGEDADRLLWTAVKLSAFTSWSTRHHVSMTVELTGQKSESKSPLMTITGWTNGLAFYKGVRQRKDLVVRWPEAWQQRVEVKQPKTLKRKSSSKKLRARKSMRVSG